MEPRPASGDSKVSITSKLNYAFQAVDHGKLLRCVTNGPWLSMDDPRETFAQLNVICEFFFFVPVDDIFSFLGRANCFPNLIFSLPILQFLLNPKVR
jgi:hypothetical protein